MVCLSVQCDGGCGYPPVLCSSVQCDGGCGYPPEVNLSAQCVLCRYVCLARVRCR